MVSFSDRGLLGVFMAPGLWPGRHFRDALHRRWSDALDGGSKWPRDRKSPRSSATKSLEQTARDRWWARTVPLPLASEFGSLPNTLQIWDRAARAGADCSTGYRNLSKIDHEESKRVWCETQILSEQRESLKKTSGFHRQGVLVT